MDAARYLVALFAVVAYPPALFYWVLVHPLTGFWRRTGLVPSYAIILTILVGIGFGVYHVRKVILSVDFGTSWLLIGLAVILIGIGMVIEVRCRRQLSFSALVGVPQLNPEGSPGKLLKEGIYGQIRHPRYVGATLGLLAVVFFVNYLATYLLMLIFLPTIYLITVLEERELIDRFGEEYRKYQRHVPRFIPQHKRVKPALDS